MTRRRHDEGFTLIEIMTVLLIISFLVAIAMASYTASTYRARRVVCRSNQRTFDEAIQIYHSDASKNVADIDDLQGYVADFDSASRCPSDGRALVLDVPNQDVYCTYPGH